MGKGVYTLRGFFRGRRYGNDNVVVGPDGLRMGGDINFCGGTKNVRIDRTCLVLALNLQHATMTSHIVSLCVDYPIHTANFFYSIEQSIYSTHQDKNSLFF